MKNKMICLIAMITLAGCTDTQQAKWSAYGEAGHIQCFSGGVKVVDAWSTGRVLKDDKGADGFAWSEADGLLHESNADCVVVHGAKKP